MIRFLLPLLLVLASPLAAAQPGAPDATFAGNGVFSYQAPNTGASRVLVRPDGRILLIGVVQGNAAVLSLRADGTVDTAYGTDGVAAFPDSRAYRAQGATLLADGSLVLSGARVDDDDTIQAGVLLKLSASGAPEATFGTGGIVELEAEEGFDQSLFVAVRELTDGSLATGGTYAASDGEGGGGVLSARFTRTGALDASYGTGGVIRTPSSSGLVAFGGVYDANGALTLTGGVAVPDGLFELDGALARVLPDGTLDASFGADGVTTFSTGFPFVLMTDARVDAEGRTVAVGISADLFAGASEALVVRFLADGTLDATFAENGIFRSTLGAAIAQTTAVAIQNDGKVLFSGTVGTLIAPEAFVGRLTTGGQLDVAFGTNGVSRVAAGTPAVGAGLALQADGRILVAGQRGNGESDPTGIVAARLLNDDVDTAAEPPARSGPLALRLAGPNPFAERTTLALDAAAPLAVHVAAYDVLGREVATLHDGPLAAGRTVLAFDASGLSPGTYLIRATAGGASATLAVVRR
ncbi:hypothetical protein [Rubricoccus marinus]|uniref:Secretion system C-terminal sorting domain-containing protein n=1 Tax=Rubricoccus marinus TaxID=716817 RepID=A0A259TVI1_9BACT|nr:hypothetical protein [Rubricoccus marinus]OZC01743.1 hypothetical protein BSZ36_01325 [Rubricoccus marinus]